ncbi:sensor histidine kinase [Streptococcus cuniculi]|uniref:histidine kinase n=1 Tax=Streptococcus cuniculi TaxID=1432788 RepID=A0A4Y9JCU1_9STRE|nr:sensor histidine kinase [Streptococcus cuniculi]MBF0777606.1 sensor histidine kinase [Streptococcus cuniculi]TFU98647.1 histidine kinase [Streptococcus cuniculi]
MKYREKIKKLCEQQTNLSPEDIETLIEQADILMKTSDYASEDVFIDVQNVYSEHATVIFHKKPQTKGSLYEKTVVGSLAYLQNEPGVIRTLHTGAPSIGLSALSQEGIPIRQTVLPILREGRVIATLILEKDSPSDFPAHFSLKTVEFSHHEVDDACANIDSPEFALLKYMEDAVLVFKQTGELIYFNPKAVEIYRTKLGYRDSLEGMHYDNLVLEKNFFSDICVASQDLTETYSISSEVQYGTNCFSVNQYVVRESQSLIMICKDISDLKRLEVHLSLERTTIREMNHRVKNNLQTVVSLLRLQSQRSQDKDVKKNLSDSVNRVLSISMTHELLSSQKNDEVAVEQLLEGVLANVQRCFSERIDIALSYWLDPTIYLDSNRATALALVVNELLQNSYDHAFETIEQKNPKIHLQIALKDDIIELQVTDNGSGYDVNQSFNNHLGLMIVERFVKSRLSGKLSIRSSHRGTKTMITFKYNKID